MGPFYAIITPCLHIFTFLIYFSSPALLLLLLLLLLLMLLLAVVLLAFVSFVPICYTERGVSFLTKYVAVLRFIFRSGTEELVRAKSPL